MPTPSHSLRSACGGLTSAPRRYLACIAHDSHNRYWVFPAHRKNPAADRVLICEVTLRNRFINDRRQLRLGIILRAERPSGADLHPHRTKVVPAHVIEKDERLFHRFNWGTPFDLNEPRQA